MYSAQCHDAFHEHREVNEERSLHHYSILKVTADGISDLESEEDTQMMLYKIRPLWQIPTIFVLFAVLDEFRNIVKKGS